MSLAQSYDVIVIPRPLAVGLGLTATIALVVSSALCGHAASR